MSKVDWEKILKQSGGKVRDDSSGFLSFILGPCHSHNITLINHNSLYSLLEESPEFHHCKRDRILTLFNCKYCKSYQRVETVSVWLVLMF